METLKHEVNIKSLFKKKTTSHFFEAGLLPVSGRKIKTAQWHLMVRRFSSLFLTPCALYEEKPSCAFKEKHNLIHYVNANQVLPSVLST